MNSAQQQTLTGEEADELPTQFWCDRCEKPHLVELVTEHEHGAHLYESREVAEETNLPPLVDRGDEEDEGDDGPEKVGEMFRITLSYTVDYRFRIPAWSESEAKRRAEELHWDVRAADEYLLHSDIDALFDIKDNHEKVPDDYDPYGDKMLWEVYGEDDNEEDNGG